MCLICVHHLLTHTFKLHVRFDKSLQLLIVTSLSFQWTKTLSMTSFNYDKELVFGKRWDLPRWLTIHPYTHIDTGKLWAANYIFTCVYLNENVSIPINILRPKQDGLQLADDIFVCALLQETFRYNVHWSLFLRVQSTIIIIGLDGVAWRQQSIACIYADKGPWRHTRH